MTVTLTPKATGEAIARSPRHLIVFQRRGARDWRILIDTYNRDVKTD